MSHLSAENLEAFVNDCLKEDLRQLEQHLNHYNEEIMEYVQLKNTIQTLHDNLDGGFKTQMNIGGNVFMEAKVERPADAILVDVGKGCYVQFTLEEAIKFVNFKIKLLTKECEVVREASVQKRTEIKLALMVIGEQEKWHALGKD